MQHIIQNIITELLKLSNDILFCFDFERIVLNFEDFRISDSLLKILKSSCLVMIPSVCIFFVSALGGSPNFDFESASEPNSIFDDWELLLNEIVFDSFKYLFLYNLIDLNQIDTCEHFHNTDWRLRVFIEMWKSCFQGIFDFLIKTAD